MLFVKTVLKESAIHGIGLFAAEMISSGSIIWKLNPLIDIKLTAEQVLSLSLPSQDRVRGYAYRQRSTGLYVLCGDDARFMNHSIPPNCVDIRDVDGTGLTVAVRDI